MKSVICVVVLVISSQLLLSIPAKAQADELAQLALNIQKLSQLKKILQNMYNGYQIISKGYNTVKDLSQGNFNLHEVFLNGLYAVNPAIKNYKRVGDIINYQARIVKGYKSAFNTFRSSSLFSVEEIEYMSTVYARLTKESLKNLEELMLIVTASKLRMSDDERLKGIDRIYADMEDAWLFLCDFNNRAEMLGFQRAKANNDVETVKVLYSIGKLN
ncbi:TerB family tellurite resistance protein [Chitinophaga sp. 212800010-3]|uniref:TerB family tellurite resistance protein n=1 Tax=unclassified Chitinophaga TaxID=2619133 RepID=UPI002DF384A9|nr:TerB family tellurite resistance protein [Chitinophaga sp. 212800010-3]